MAQPCGKQVGLAASGAHLYETSRLNGARRRPFETSQPGSARGMALKKQVSPGGQTQAFRKQVQLETSGARL
jgi:hypothetical protein